MTGRHQQDGFAEFVSARWEPLVRTAVFLGCAPQDAQDLVQATLARCLAKWGRVRRARDRDGYVYRVLINCLRDSSRRAWNAEHPSDTVVEQVVADPADQIAVAHVVHQSLASLSDEHRAVVVLRYFSDLTEDQVASVLEVPTGTVKSRLSRARSQLAADPGLDALSTGESNA